METLAIIPARGGSKGVSRKNVKVLAGKPLIAWTIEAAKESQSVTRVVVSTDDREIADVAQVYGAEVVWRPEELSGDKASSESALLHVLTHLEERDGYLSECLVFLQCTSPLTRAADIDGAVTLLRDDEKVDSVVAVAPFHSFVWKCDEEGSGLGINHDKTQRLRRQDRAPEFVEAGAVYAMRTAGFCDAQHRFFGKTALYEMPAERCHEIDEPYDFRIAEMLLRKRHELDRGALLPSVIDAVVFDFDGVFTDNRVLIFDDGHEGVVCSRGDGMGLGMLHKRNIPLLVLSAEVNQVVRARCRKLKMDCIHGCTEKLPALRTWALQHDVRMDHLVYVGNDVNDVACLRDAGCGVVVGDAAEEARQSADLVLNASGGNHAVRELCDLILKRLESGNV